jgi:hypothetical protein
MNCGNENDVHAIALVKPICLAPSPRESPVTKPAVIRQTCVFGLNVTCTSSINHEQ